jgi:hypothetical protein
MKRIIVLISIMTLLVGGIENVVAQTERNPMKYYGEGAIVPAWLDSGRQVYAEFKVNTTNGDYRNIYEPKRQTLYAFTTTGRAAVSRNFSLGGMFAYGYYDRREQCWGMQTFAQSSPFYLADDQAGRQTSERYKLKGNMLYKLLDGKFLLAGEFDFMAVSTAKQKDIRNNNTYSYYSLRPMTGLALGKLTIVGGYGYTSATESVGVAQFGDDKELWLTVVDAFWFGRRQIYSPTQMLSRRYVWQRHSGVLNVGYSSERLRIGGEVLLYKGTLEVDVLTESNRVGLTDENGMHALVQIRHGVHNVEAEVSSEAETGYLPIQRREYNGKAYHYVQYGKTRRSERETSDWHVRYGLETISAKCGVTFGGHNINRRMLLYPYVYEEQIRRLQLNFDAEYVLYFRTSALTVEFDIAFTNGNDTDERLTNIDNLPEGYYFEQTAFERQHDYETSDNIMISPRLKWMQLFSDSRRFEVGLNYSNVVNRSEADMGRRSSLMCRIGIEL